MSKISSVNKDRIHRMYVDRKIVVSGVSNVKRVDAIKPVHNEASSVNENFLLFAGSFYDKILDLKKYYNEFYLDQQSLGDIMEKFKEKKDDASLEEIIIIIQELVEKYNKAIGSLKNFQEKLPNINFSEEINEVIYEYKESLSTIGITITEDQLLSFNPTTLIGNLEFQPNCLFFLFDYQNGLIRKLFSIFRNIKVSQTMRSHNYGESPTSISGMLIDNKS